MVCSFAPDYSADAPSMSSVRAQESATASLFDDCGVSDVEQDNNRELVI